MQLVRRIITVFMLAVCALICSSLYAHATVTVTVHPQDLSSSAAPDDSTSVVATLRGCGSNPPIVVGTSMLAPTSKTFTPVIGVVTMPLYSSSEISCGGQTGVTWYDITMQSDGSDIWKASYTFSASGDLSSMQPNTSAPVVAAPTGDSTYARVDNANTGAWLPLFGGDPTLQLGGATKQYVDNLPIRNNAFTGNNTHSGTESFTGPVSAAQIAEILYTSPEVDGPGTALNLNECQALARQQQIANSLAWKAMHLISGWHSHQHCGISDPNANYPSAIGANPPTFAEWLDMQPDNLIVVDQSFVPRANQHWDFHNSNSSLASASTGVQAGFAASTAFNWTSPAGGPAAVVEYGAPDGTSLASGGQPQGVQIENAGIYGFEPGVGSWHPGSICVRNQYAQEFSYLATSEIDGCQIGFDKQDSGTGFGSINDGPHRLLKINMTGCNTTDCRAIRIGKGNAENNDVSNSRGFEHISANTSGALVEPAIAIELNGAGIPLYDIHLEQWTEGIALGDLGFAKNNTLTQIECDGTIAKPFTTCVHIYNTNEFGNTYGNKISTVSSTGNLTNLLVDERSGGGTATWAVSGTLTDYSHSLGGNVISSSPEIPSRMTFATGASLNSLTSPTANAIFAMGGFKLELDGSASQATSLLSLQGQASNTNAIPLLNVTTGSSTEKAFSFCTAGKGCIASDASNNLQLTNTQTATGGANFGSPTIFVQGRYWNGSVSSGEGVTQGLTYGAGANPTATYSFALAGAGTGVHSMDFSNWAKVLSKNISTGTASNTDLAGTIAISASTTGAYTFAQTYTSAPICTVSPNADTTSVGVWWKVATTTTLTVNVKTSGTISFDYHCVGRN